MDYKYTVREITKSASRALSALYAKCISCGGMTYDVYNKLYKSLVEPVLYYGASLWGHTNWREVQTVQNKVCRRFLGCASNAPNVASQGDMGYYSSKSIQSIETFRLFLRLRITCDTRLTYKIHMWNMNISRSWDKKCIEKVNNLDIMDIINSPFSNRNKVQNIKSKLCNINHTEWVNNLFDDRNEPNGNKLRTYRKFKSFLNVSSYVKDVLNRQHRRILSNFRSGCLSLAVKTGRFYWYVLLKKMPN